MPEPLTIHIQYFAMLREQRGVSREILATHAATPAALYRELAARHGFTLEPGQLGVACNDCFVAMDNTLRDGDMVTFIPPVAGG